MRERLAHVSFRGTIRERSVEPYARLLHALRGRRRIRGVLLDISSGGGESIASMDFYLAVKRLNEVKPVFAAVGSMAASGAYMAALGARRIFAYPESLVGSIGVIFPHFAARDLLRRLGISVELLHVGEHKDAYQGYRPLTEVERGKLMAVAQEGYDEFVGLVARERKRPVEEIRALATGEFWTGRTALKLGLVDVLGDREDALAALSQATGVPVTKAVRIGPPRSLMDRVMGGGGYGFSGLSGRLHDAIEDAALDLGGFGLLR
ncbi:MAG: signal peptide peptidase SppA [Thermoplasmata archaeon]|jgi:protease-4|nr:signal peptide peptidase SppA [Thermoplasmata archaeon]